MQPDRSLEGDYLKHPLGIASEVAGLIRGYAKKPHYFALSVAIFGGSYIGTSYVFDRLQEHYYANEPKINAFIKDISDILF